MAHIAAKATHVRQGNAQKGEHRLGVPGPEGLQRLKLAAGGGGKGPVLQGAVQLHGEEGHFRADLSSVFVYSPPKFSHTLLWQGQPRRHGVPAVAGQKVPALRDRLEQIEALHAPAAAPGLAVPRGQHYAGLAVHFAEPCCRYAHHAVVPALPAHHQHPVEPELRPLLKLLLRGPYDLCLHRLAVLVLLAYLLGQKPGALRVPIGQQAHGPLRRAHAAGGVDAGYNGESQLCRGDLLAVQKGGKPWTLPAVRYFQAPLHYQPILPGKADGIPHGAKCRQVAVLLQHCPSVPLQGHKQL